MGCKSPPFCNKGIGRCQSGIRPPVLAWSAKAVNIHPIFLGVGGTIYTGHTLKQFRQLGLDHQRATKLAEQLHAHSVQYAHKLVSTRRAIENKNTSHSQVLEPSASSIPPDPH
eukprot:1148787-Pelagomonas_calceolata.AAC.1